MGTRAYRVSKALKEHDVLLYAAEVKEGMIHVFRKSRDLMRPPHFVLALTDNWQANGKPVEYGALVIMARIKAMDLWRDDTIVEALMKENEKASESKSRDRRNSVESFLYDFRDDFKRTFAYTNTSNFESKTRRMKDNV